jgi:hypothetical protein
MLYTIKHDRNKICVSHGGEYVDGCLLGCSAVVDVYQRFRGPSLKRWKTTTRLHGAITNKIASLVEAHRRFRGPSLKRW